MIWNFWCRCIYPLRCRFRDKDSMADTPVILLRPKAEVHAQPISPFPSRLHGRLRAAPGRDNGGGGRVHGVDAVVHGPHLAPALHHVAHVWAGKLRNGIGGRQTATEMSLEHGSGGSPVRAARNRTGRAALLSPSPAAIRPPREIRAAAACRRRESGRRAAGSGRRGGGKP